MQPMDLTIGNLAPDELEQDARLRSQAFSVDLGPYDPKRPPVPLDRVHVARAGDRIVGTVTVFPFGQWFGGRSVPMGGVAGVAIAPEARGQGLAGKLLEESIAAMRDRGEAISALYPTAPNLYRSMGYEVAGRYERTTVDITTIAEVGRGDRGLPSSERSVSLHTRPLRSGEVRLIRPVYDRLASESNGWLDRSDLFWDRLDYDVDPDRRNSFGYLLVDDDDVAHAGLTVSHRQGDAPLKFGLDVGGPFATSPEALERALALVAAMGTTADRATVSLPVESLGHSVPAAYLQHQDSWLWMLRIVDVDRAMTLRGYNPAIIGEMQFTVADRYGPWNNGRWSLAVSDGRATVAKLSNEPSANEGTLVMDIQTLSCLYTGFVSPVELARAGRLPGADPAALATLASIFCGGPPRVVDFF